MADDADKQPDLSKAAARPWRVYSTAARFPGIEALDRSVAVFGRYEGSESGIRGRTQEEADANAALIVKAVNERDELVAALRQAQRAFVLIGGQCGTPDPAEGHRLILATLDRNRRIIEAALAKAETPA